MALLVAAAERHTAEGAVAGCAARQRGSGNVPRRAAGFVIRFKPTSPHHLTLSACICPALPCPAPADEDEDSQEEGAGGGGGRARGRAAKKGKAAAGSGGDAASVKATREKARREKLNEWCARLAGCLAGWLVQG